MEYCFIVGVSVVLLLHASKVRKGGDMDWFFLIGVYGGGGGGGGGAFSIFVLSLTFHPITPLITYCKYQSGLWGITTCRTFWCSTARNGRA